MAIACRLSKASGADSSDATVGVDLLTDENEHLEVLADSAYGSGPARATLAEAGRTAIIKPIPLRPPVPGGFTADDFAIDHSARTATCPAGTGRALHISEHDPLLRAARRYADTDAFQQPYRQRDWSGPSFTG